MVQAVHDGMLLYLFSMHSRLWYMVIFPQPSAETVALLPMPEPRDGVMLQDLLKDKGQSTKGKKEDLVKRIMDYQKREAIASRPH